MGEVTLDTSDVDRWVGVPLGGGYLKDPVHVNDIRRWAQGMQNPNPLLRRPLRRRGRSGASWRPSRSPWPPTSGTAPRRPSRGRSRVRT